MKWVSKLHFVIEDSADFDTFIDFLFKNGKLSMSAGLDCYHGKNITYNDMQIYLIDTTDSHPARFGNHEYHCRLVKPGIQFETKGATVAECIPTDISPDLKPECEKEFTKDPYAASRFIRFIFDVDGIVFTFERSMREDCSYYFFFTAELEEKNFTCKGQRLSRSSLEDLMEHEKYDSSHASSVFEGLFDTWQDVFFPNPENVFDNGMRKILKSNGIDDVDGYMKAMREFDYYDNTNDDNSEESVDLEF